ncbi:MAG: hypothetical protein RLZZ501_1595 [Pseudomonadota bacterium]|jgi:transcriptional regulator of acetoin/glycerol metabolism
MTQTGGRAPSRLRDARALLDHGELPPPGTIDPAVCRSWQRCLAAGLHPGSAPLGESGRLGLDGAIDRRHHLLRRARPVMEYLHAHLRDSGSVVLLADQAGLVIDALGDAAFLERADRVALRPGACWDETARGTNAIGTALAEAAPVSVHGAEHFLAPHRFLTCAAAPLAGPDGTLLGVIDISGPHRARPPHALGLIAAAGQMIERALFEAEAAGALRLRLHPQAEGLGTLAEGLVALSEDGRVIAATPAGRALLGLGCGDLGRARIEPLLGLSAAMLLDHAHAGAERPLSGRTGAGRPLFVRVDPLRRHAVALAPPRPPAAARPARPAPTPVAAPQDALAALDTGDARMRTLLDRARRVLGKPIPILLQGESGVGKELFATAIHAAGPRRDRPLVAVNCAALPEPLIEAELFGYAPGAFTGARRDGAPGRIREADGGTLFLDEIGDMPLSLQGRLLRVLQERRVVPLGGGKPVAVDFALIAASHRPLKAEIDTGRFRADLYYRLNGLTLTLPPLRERGDFAALAARLLAEFAPGERLRLAPGLATALARYRWPGNLRQFANALRFACAMLDPGETDVARHMVSQSQTDAFAA